MLSRARVLPGGELKAGGPCLLGRVPLPGGELEGGGILLWRVRNQLSTHQRSIPPPFSSPPGKGVAPILHGVAPILHGVAPILHGVAPILHGVTFIVHGVTPIPHGATLKPHFTIHVDFLRRARRPSLHRESETPHRTVPGFMRARACASRALALELAAEDRCG